MKTQISKSAYKGGDTIFSIQKKEECQIDTGSITVFLTILFLLFFSLIGVAFENARVLSASGYVRTAAHSAAMTVFGNYNKELYNDYGFFAFGGYDGKGAEDLADEVKSVLEANIAWHPENAEASYGDLYRLCEMDVSVMETDILSYKKVFLEQIEAYLKQAAVEDLTDTLLKKNSAVPGENGMADKLTLTKEYEEGRFDTSEKTEIKKGSLEGKARPQKDVLQDAGDRTEGNPLKSFSKMMRDGILGLVCNPDMLADGVVAERNADGEQGNGNVLQKKEKAGAAAYLKWILVEEKDLAQQGEKDGALKKGINKVKYICYANKQFSCYTRDRHRTTKYGQEYLVAGKHEERDNLSKIVNKLLRIRLLLNFAVIASNAVLQEKSMVTATVLAGFTGMPPVIQAVQYTILLILAFEEACIDVMALLDGKKIPVVKGPESLKMQYEEICFASRELFKSKASAYSKEGGGVANITYEQYVWIFLLEQPEKELHSRSLDLIQYDMREKYNQTFVMDTCICRSRYIVHYRIPFLFEKLPYLSGRLDNGAVREMEVEYGYKSG